MNSDSVPFENHKNNSMSLNDIILSPVTISALYKKSLVDTGAQALKKQETVTPKSGESTATPFIPAYLGNNLRQVAILVQYEDEVYLPEEQLQFLTSILKACQLNIADIAIINAARHPAGPDTLKENLGTRQLIVFGVFKGITDGMEAFTIAERNGISLLVAPELEKLNQQTADGKLLKGKLWLCLKQLFNV